MLTLERFHDVDILDPAVLTQSGSASLCRRLAARELAHCKKLVIDMSSIESLDSEALGCLVGIHKLILGRGGRVRLCGVCPELQVLLELVRLDDFFLLEETRAQAIRAFEKDNQIQEVAS